MILISRWCFSTQRMGNQAPSALQLCHPIGSWWKWQRECGRDTFVLTASAWKCRSSLSLLSHWWEFIPERDPAARRIRNVACGWAATSWLQLCFMEKEKRWKWAPSRCHRRNWKCQNFMCNVCGVYCLISKEQGRNFPNRSLFMVVLFFLQASLLSATFSMEPP